MITNREKILIEIIRQKKKELAQIRQTLSICANCHDICDEKNVYHPIADYLHNHFGLNFSHGICHNCAKKLYPEFYKGK